MKIGLIGYGYWGGGFVARNIARVADLAVIVDPNPANLVKASSVWAPWGTRVASEPEVAFRECDAVWIATPTRTHYELCLEALESDCHVMCEKPFVMDAQQADELLQTAETAGLALQVGFTALYMESHAAARQALWSEKNRVWSVRQTAVPSESDVNVLWGLGPHDIAAVVDMFGEPIQAVWAGNDHSVVGDLIFENENSARLEFDWLARERSRAFVVNKRNFVSTIDAREPLLKEAESFVWLCENDDPAAHAQARLLAQRVTEALAAAALTVGAGVAA